MTLSFRTTTRYFVPKAVSSAPSAKVPPSLGRRAANLALAAGQVAAEALRGKPTLVSAEVQERRRLVCEACSDYYRLSDQVCTHPRCGCYMRVKRWFSALPCPDGRWK